MLRRVALVRADVSEENIASVIRMTRICELRKTLAISSNRSTLRRNIHITLYIVFICSVLRLLVTAKIVSSSPSLVTLMMEEICSSKTSVVTKAMLRNIPEDGIPHSHRREDF
jgi:hypothetical protein